MSDAIYVPSQPEDIVGLPQLIYTGVNLFNPDDPDVRFGQFLNNASSYTPSNGYTYNITGYIPVKPSTTYATNPLIRAQRRAFYDANKTLISGEYLTYNGSLVTFTTPANCRFIRQTVPYLQWRTCQIQEGSSVTSWVPYGFRPAPVPANPIQRESLRQTRLKLSKLALPTPESAQLVINLYGDSYTHNATRWSQPFAQTLTGKYGDAGGGWCGFGGLSAGNTAPWTSGNQPSYTNGNARPTTYPTRLYGNIVQNYYTKSTCDLASATLSASGDAIEQDYPASPTISAGVLHWIGTGSGSIRYTFNGGTNWTTLSVSGTSGTTATTTLSLTGYSGAGTLRIEWVSGTAELCGVDLQSAASGVRVNKLAATGSAISAWAQNTTGAGFATSTSALGAHLCIDMDGPNSQTGGVSGTTWSGYLLTFISRLRTVIGASTDILYVSPPENPRTNQSIRISSYEQAARLLAYAYNFAHLDLQPAFGDPSNTAEYKSTGTLPLFNSDDLHPEPTTGGRVMMAEIIRALVPF
jgi:hypothetical protein